MFTGIRDITPSNKEEILSLDIQEKQQGFIETISQCLEEAKKDHRFTPLGLYKNGIAVGFAMYGEFGDRVWLDRYLIDERFQGKGLGTYFLQKLIDFLIDTFHCDVIYLSVYDDNTHAIHLYEKFGFQFTGERDKHGEKIMRKEIIQDDNH